MSLRGSAILIAAFFAAVQFVALAPDGFVTGDQGSKYLQTRAFADRGPFDPGIDVASRDIDPAYRQQEPKLKNRRGRLVSEFLWLLPLTAAPFLRLFGMRGLYVVPALSVIAMFLTAATIGRRAGDPKGLVAGWILVLATPVAIYGLELWEHAPAAACVLIAAWLLAPSAPPGDAVSIHRPHSTGFRHAAAGAAIAVGALFREEAIVAAPALILARAALVDRGRFRALAATSLWVAAGMAAVFLAAVPVNLMIYGAALPMHMTQDAWDVARTTPYMQVRRDFLVDLFLPASHTAVFIAAIAAGVAASAIARRRRIRDGGAALTVVHASVLVVLVICVALPLWRLATGVRGHDAYRLTSAAHTWPFALALLYAPWMEPADGRPIARYLILSALLLIVLTDIVVPSSGGAQWSPRFLLAVVPLLAVALGVTVWTPVASAEPPPRLDVVSAVAIVLFASIVMQATGFAFVQREKARHASITHALEARTAPGDVVITTVFWVPEVAATLAPSRRMLFAWSPADVPSMAAMAVGKGIRRFSLVTLVPFNGYDAPPTLDVPGAPCRFVRGHVSALDAQGSTLSRYECATP
jgi:hypothetical protein